MKQPVQRHDANLHRKRLSGVSRQDRGGLVLSLGIAELQHRPSVIEFTTPGIFSEMTKASTLNRRDLLLGATPAATVMILGATGTDGKIAEAATPAVNYVPVFFNPAEWRFINAAVGRLIPSDSNGLVAWKQVCRDS